MKPNPRSALKNLTRNIEISYLSADKQALAVIREAIRKEGMVALGRVVFTSREHVIALEPRGKICGDAQHRSQIIGRR
jgi:hypothetical protein